MYNVTIISVSEPFVSFRDNLNRQEMLEAYKEWLENNLNVYSSFFLVCIISRTLKKVNTFYVKFVL